MAHSGQNYEGIALTLPKKSLYGPPEALFFRGTGENRDFWPFDGRVAI